MAPAVRARSRGGGGTTVYHGWMAQVVEISLRLPSLRVRPTPDAEVTTIDNSIVRFTKHVELPSIPKPGETLSMSVDGGESFPCEVVQSNWHHSKNIFVVACKYGKRTVSPDTYHAIVNAPDWQSTPLL